MKAALVFGFSNIRHVLALQANYVKSNLVFQDIFLLEYGLKMNTNNFIGGRILIQMVLVLDLQ